LEVIALHNYVKFIGGGGGGGGSGEGWNGNPHTLTSSIINEESTVFLRATTLDFVIFIHL
jgi:hypothetical protein